MPEAYLYKERRIHPRVSVMIPISYSVMEAEKEIASALEERRMERHGHTLDVSLGGLFIMSEHPLKEGEILDIRITIPGLNNILSATTEVVWSNEKGGGVRFLRMKEEEMKTLKAYLDRATARES